MSLLLLFLVLALPATLQGQTVPGVTGSPLGQEAGTAPTEQETQSVRPDRKTSRKQLRKQLKAHKPAIKDWIRSMKRNQVGKLKRKKDTGGTIALVFGVVLLALALFFIALFALLLAAGDVLALFVFFILGPVALIALILGIILLIVGLNNRRPAVPPMRPEGSDI